jgi:import inner membrane translocase subunit TIM16
VIITGTRVLGRAFTEAYRQASASSAYVKAQQKTNPNFTGSASSSHSGLTLDEACKILNIKPPPPSNPSTIAEAAKAAKFASAEAAEESAKKSGEAYAKNLMERFKKLFDVNDPKKGGSFYLQSKVLRARERIESELRKVEEARGREEELREGWKPKVFKDR